MVVSDITELQLLAQTVRMFILLRLAYERRIRRLRWRRTSRRGRDVLE